MSIDVMRSAKLKCRKIVKSQKNWIPLKIENEYRHYGALGALFFVDLACLAQVDVDVM
jgi:hypothetical protein